MKLLKIMINCKECVLLIVKIKIMKSVSPMRSKKRLVIIKIWKGKEKI
jgi:hypothetical protein